MTGRVVTAERAEALEVVALRAERLLEVVNDGTPKARRKLAIRRAALRSALAALEVTP